MLYVENFRFLHICHVDTSEISPHVEKFSISSQLSYMESWNVSTWQFFLHEYNSWYPWQISGLSSSSSRWSPKKEKWPNLMAALRHAVHRTSGCPGDHLPSIGSYQPYHHHFVRILQWCWSGCCFADCSIRCIINNRYHFILRRVHCYSRLQVLSVLGGLCVCIFLIKMRFGKWYSW